MAAPIFKSWTREEYDRLADLGILQPDERLELVDGQIVQKMTHKPPHAIALTLVQGWLGEVIRAGMHVRAQLPIALSDVSEPEPDLAVVRGRVRDYAKIHPEPKDVFLIIEISDSSLQRDRSMKAPLYAKAGIPELWILDLTARRLEIHREPTRNGYRSVTFVAEDESASTESLPGYSLLVSDVLPDPE